MGTYLFVLVVMVMAAGLPMVLELRLRNRHPEAYRELVARLVADDVKPKRFRSELLWRFLTERRHKNLNDPALSVLSDSILAALAFFLVACVGGLIWIFGHASFFPVSR